MSDDREYGLQARPAGSMNDSDWKWFTLHGVPFKGKSKKFIEEEADFQQGLDKPYEYRVVSRTVGDWEEE